jgi:CHC2 zinc finger
MTFDRNFLPDTATYFENQGLPLKGSRSAKWKTTTCNFHGGSDSMRVNVATGAWVCMSCGEKGGDVLAYEIKDGGREFVDAAKALGCWVDDGRLPLQTKPTPLSPRLALSVMAFESTLTAVAAGNVAHGVMLTDSDRARLMVAANRINRLAEAFA